MKNRKFEIQAKRWFQRTYGNTYFSAKVYEIEGGKYKLLGQIDYEYGYGDQCIQEALKVFERQTGILRAAYSNGMKENMWQFMEAHGIDYNIVDVKRKKDL